MSTEKCPHDNPVKMRYSVTKPKRGQKSVPDHYKFCTDCDQVIVIIKTSFNTYYLPNGIHPIEIMGESSQGVVLKE